MRKNSEPILGRTNHSLGRRPRFTSLSKVLGGILFAFLLQNPIQSPGASVPGPYSVDLRWDRSPDSSVTGYRVYYGGASGIYTNSLAVGNVTSNKVQGLFVGVTYFFAVTAYGTNGVESLFSNETIFVPGLPTVHLRMATNRQAVLTVKGLIGQTYDILATQTFGTWTVIGSVTLGASGSMDFTDVNAASFPRRLYRTKQRP